MSNALLRLPITGNFADPAAASAVITVGRVPLGGGKMTLTAASAALSLAITSSGANYVGVQFHKTGIDGKATPVEITAAAGGASVAWAAGEGKACAPIAAAAVLEPGEYITATYSETGAVAPGVVSTFLELAPGVA